MRTLHAADAAWFTDPHVVDRCPDVPAIALDVLDSMQRRGVITEDAALAGDRRFRNWFRIATLDRLNGFPITVTS